jgi:asparagine synthase (glutamine-hydrolysing)
MCGIVGIYNFKGNPVDSFLVQRMVKTLEHRGPDDEGIYIDKNFGLGHRRLSIIDTSKAGRQPMVNKDESLFIVFNGEIYNFQKLREILKGLGHQFKSKTDTEVVLHGYEEWGTDCLKRFDGMFAFAILDRKNSQFFLARDRMGEKPLYYYIDQERFIFASEIKAIIEDQNVIREIGNQGLINYFTFGHSIAPDTIYKNIKKLLPGHYLVVKDGRTEIKEYWDSLTVGEKKDRGEKYYKQKTREIFEEAVKEELISDVPLGVFLSGGIDSSSVVAMMAKNEVSPLRTFSVGFDLAGGEFNELRDAKVVAKHFKTEHHELFLREPDLINALNKLVYYYDEPFGDAAAFPVFYLSQFAKKYVKVVLTGEGGDEIFGGYRRYIVENIRSNFSALNLFSGNNMFNKAIEPLPGLRRTKKLIETVQIEDDLLRYTNWLVFFSKEKIRGLLKDKLLAGRENPLKTYKEYFSRYQTENLLDKIMYLDQKILLPDCYLEKVDKASMAFGLETRSPILNHRLVEFANSVPSKYKVKGIKTKYILKEAMKDVLPRQILEKKKHGLSVPTNAWFRGKLKNYLFEIVFDKKTRARGYFNFSYIEKLYKNYQNKNQPLDSQLWLILNFELWHRQFIDSRSNN